MAFLDWPLSNGSINPQGWLQDRSMRAEHSHRLLGAKLGFLSIALVIWTQLREKRRWVRWLTLVSLTVIIAQGILGGLRVLLDSLNIDSGHNLYAQTFAVFHACGAQLVLCLLITLAVVSSRVWIASEPRAQAVPLRTVRALGMAGCALIAVQVLLGAIMRHSNTGLAIPTFPHSTLEGDWLPAAWNWAVSLNFSHRIGALLITAWAVALSWTVWSNAAFPSYLRTLSLLSLLIVVAQITMGAITTLSAINEHAATLHMLLGAFLLATTWMLTLLTFRGAEIGRPEAHREARMAALSGGSTGIDLAPTKIP